MKSFYDIKSYNKNKVVFIKKGMFYVTYNEDAFLTSQLSGYKVILPEYKLGYPISKMNDIKDKFISSSISVVFVDNNNVKEYSVPDNKYLSVIKVYIKKYIEYKNIDNFMNNLKLSIYKDISLMDKINKLLEEDNDRNKEE